MYNMLWNGTTSVSVGEFANHLSLFVLVLHLDKTLADNFLFMFISYSSKNYETSTFLSSQKTQTLSTLHIL